MPTRRCRSSGTELPSGEFPATRATNADRGGPFGGPVRPFLNNPTSCTGPVLTSLRVNSWQEPNNYQEASFLSHNAAMEPVGTDGCDKLPFEPSLNLQSDPPSAASPTALSATLHVPQHNDDPDRADHLAPEEGGRHPAAGSRGQPGRGERPRRLQRGAVRPQQRQPGELPQRLEGRHGRNRQPAARTAADRLDLPRPAERQPVRQPAGDLHGSRGAGGDDQGRRQDRH